MSNKPTHLAGEELWARCRRAKTLYIWVPRLGETIRVTKVTMDNWTYRHPDRKMRVRVKANDSSVLYLDEPEA